MIRKSLFLFFSVCNICVSQEASEDICNWPKEWRKKALVRLDVVISQAIPFASRAFVVDDKEPIKQFANRDEALEEFIVNHGYFSCVRPLVGIVTRSSSDTKEVEKALVSLRKDHPPLFFEMAVGELLTKALAYRDLQQGDQIVIPTLLEQGPILVSYVVDTVLDLWHGMPAFGLLPSDKRACPLLLFRGTDFSLLSKKSWASILSDLDTTGVGLSVFQTARPKIQEWLKKANQIGLKTKVMGFSLGGVLSLYTVLFDGDLVSDRGSLAFNPPGVSASIATQWSNKCSSQINLYITNGDLVSKLGKLVPDSWVLAEQEHLGPIQAHTKMMTANASFSLSSVSVVEENKNRFTTK